MQTCTCGRPLPARRTSSAWCRAYELGTAWACESTGCERTWIVNPIDGSWLRKPGHYDPQMLRTLAGRSGT
jgi:hypothetical protein